MLNFSELINSKLFFNKNSLFCNSTRAYVENDYISRYILFVIMTSVFIIDYRTILYYTMKLVHMYINRKKISFILSYNYLS